MIDSLGGPNQVNNMLETLNQKTISDTFETDGEKGR